MKNKRSPFPLLFKNLVLILVAGFFLSSCTWLRRVDEAEESVQEVTESKQVQNLPQNNERGCANSRLKISYDLYGKAKDFFSSYYKTRKISELFYAWYSSEDSTNMAVSVGKCRDKRNKHFYAVKSLRKSNFNMQDLIVQNMRSENQTKINEIFMEEYRKIFPRDIQ